MKKYKVKFYKENKKGSYSRVFIKTFFVYNDTWEAANEIALKKLAAFREQEKDDSIQHWIDPVGINAIANF